MNLPAFTRTPDGYHDNATGEEHYSLRDANFSVQALNQIMSNAIDAYNAALKLRDIQTVPWAERTRGFEETKLANAVSRLADVQAERVEKGYAR